MRAAVIALCLFLASGALAQSTEKLKAIKAANEAADKANAIAVGVHKREAGDAGGGQAVPEKEAKPKPTPEPK